MRRPRFASLVGLLAMGAGVLVLTASAASAGVPRSADNPVSYTVTLVARSCGAYTDVMANRARNNIQESLRDLGKDTVYSAGQPVDPSIEGPNNPSCVPLDGWRFTLGDGGGGPKVDHLSTVTNGSAPTPATGTVPLLDNQGSPTGQTIRGATTVTLTPAQLALAQRQNLWVQGGTPADPLLNGTFPSLYGFAALRCAIDNLNGDNVEWVAYPNGYRHVFCYYYAVTPPPDASTIVVRKQLEGGTDGPGVFTYLGNISYTPNQDFTLTADSGTTASMSFVRAAGSPWDFEEQPLTGWTFVGVACTPSASATITGRKVVVVADPGQTVVCTYTNRRDPTGTLQLDKTTLGGLGTFPMTITVPPPGTPIATSVTTTKVGEATLVATSNGATPGTYTATETLPAATGAGSWDLSRAECNGQDITGTVVPIGQQRTVSRFVGVGQQAICNLTNTFTPDGSLTIRKTTDGGVGTFHFVVFDAVTDDSGTQVGEQQATTVTPGTPVAAAGDPLDHLYVTDETDPASTSRRYFIQELSPPDTTAGSWRLTHATCDGGTVTATDTQGIFVTLSPGHPDAVCDFTNAFVPVATLDLVKVVSGPLDARSGPVVVHLACDDGTDATLTGPAGSTGPFQLPDTYVFRDPTSCTVHETATGAAAEVAVKTTIALETGGSTTTTDGLTRTFPVAAGDRITITVTDAYTGVAPTQTATGSATSTPLPPTGPGDTATWSLWAGIGLLAGGGLLLLASEADARRGRRAR